jgi:hypothetical protein
MMTFPSKSISVAAFLTLLASSGFAQTSGTATPPAAPAQEQGAQQPPGMGGQSSEPMREMMRQMMQEMMQEGRRKPPRTGGNRGTRAERGDGDHRWNDGSRMDQHGGTDMARSHGGMRSGMMHGAGMQMMFAIVDADSDGALSLNEVQDFHGRIFHAVDGNDDGSVEMEEIEAFFHGREDEAAK